MDNRPETPQGVLAVTVRLRCPIWDSNRQALTAEALAKENVNVIYSSDLLRAVQTAEPLSKINRNSDRHKARVSRA